MEENTRLYQSPSGRYYIIGRAIYDIPGQKMDSDEVGIEVFDKIIEKFGLKKNSVSIIKPARVSGTLDDAFSESFKKDKLDKGKGLIDFDV
jgi:hypothetical protein